MKLNLKKIIKTCDVTAVLIAVSVLPFIASTGYIVSQLNETSNIPTESSKQIKNVVYTYDNYDSYNEKLLLKEVTLANDDISAIQTYKDQEEMELVLIEKELIDKQKKKEEEEARRRLEASKVKIWPNMKENYLKTTNEDVNRLVDKYCKLFKFNRPDIVHAIIKAESGCNQYASNGYAAGYMQIEYTLEDSFKKFGRDYFGESWTLDDRYDAEKNIAFGIYNLHILDIHYNGDMEKVIQGYNYSHFSLDKLINIFGNDWKNHRTEIAYYNGVYNRTGSTRYGNPKYIERVESFL